MSEVEDLRAQVERIAGLLDIPGHQDWDGGCPHVEDWLKVATHTRSSQPENGPDFCTECSEAIQEWVPWPCPRARAAMRGYGCTVCGRSDRVLHPAAWWVKDNEGRLVGQTIVRGSFCSYLCFEVWALAVERDQLADDPCRDCGAPKTTDGRCLLLEKHSIEEEAS